MGVGGFGVNLFGLGRGGHRICCFSVCEWGWVDLRLICLRYGVSSSLLLWCMRMGDGVD